MSNSRRNLYALMIAGVSFIVVIGAMLTALAETGFSPAQAGSATDTTIPILIATTKGSAATPPSAQPTATPLEDPDLPVTPTSAEPATSTSSVVSISPTSSSVTPSATVQATQVKTCTQPLGWTTYTVKSGDTLYSIAIRYQSTVAALQVGNCLGGTTKIITGWKLWVPNNATITPSQTPVPSLTKAVCYTLTLSIVGNGSQLTAAPQKSEGCTNGSYVAGEKVTLTASAAAGWTIGSWTGTDNNSSTVKTNTVTMPAKNHSASVTYLAPTCYTLTISHTGSGGDPTVSPGNSAGCNPGTYQVGEIITLTASPNLGWSVAFWTGTQDDNSISTSNSVIMPAKNHTASVAYKAICYTLTLNFTGTGTAPSAAPSSSASCAAGSYVVDEYITLTANPGSGGTVSSWVGTDDDGSKELTNYWTMQASDHAVTVNYSP